MLLGWWAEIWIFCTTCTIEFLNAFIYECWRCIFMCYCYPSTEEHLKLFGKRVFNIWEIILKLFLTGNFSSLSNRAYNLRHLQEGGKKYTLASGTLWQTNCKIKRLPVVIFLEGHFDLVSKNKRPVEVILHLFKRHIIAVKHWEEEFLICLLARSSSSSTLCQKNFIPCNALLIFSKTSASEATFIMWHIPTQNERKSTSKSIQEAMG